MALVNQGGALRVVGGALGTGQECCCGAGGVGEVTCGMPSRTNENNELEFYINDAWTVVVNPSQDFTDPLDIGYYCDPFECNALTGYCVWLFYTGGPSDWYSSFGAGYGRLCPTCPQEPTHTLCLPFAVGEHGPGPTPSYGIPQNYPHLIVTPGATCAEWCSCSGPFMEWRYDVDNDPTYAQDCSQCIDWCNPEDCSYVVTGRNLTGNLVECNGCNPLP
jgi:hypothetical protein